MLDREGAQGHGIDRGEDGGVDPDPERQRGQGRQHQSGLPGQAPSRESEVPPGLLQPLDRVRGPGRLRHGRPVAEREPGGPGGLLRLHPPRHQLSGPHFEVVGHFLVDPPVHDVVGGKDPAEAVKPAHASLHANTSWTPEVSRLHCAFSCSNCFRPAGVIE